MFIPRIGHEVIVDFLEGDPDRPIITGRVYHATNTPPNILPGDMTKSSIKSSSSMGGGGFNEITFEDKKGAEKFITHAQRDQTEKVRRNMSTSVGGNQSISVGGNQSIHVTGVQTITVDGKKGEPGKHGTLKVTGDMTLESTNEVMIKAPKKLTLDVDGTTATLTPGVLELDSGQGAFISLDGPNVWIDGVKVDITGEKINVSATMLSMGGTAKADLTSAGPVTVSGTPVQLNGPGPFAGRVMELSPDKIRTGAATVLVGGASFPFEVVKLADGRIQVGDNMFIKPGADDTFQNKVLRDLGIMSTTTAGLQRLNNINSNPSGHDVTFREWNAADIAKYGVNNSTATPQNPNWTNSRMTTDADGDPVPGAGTGTVIAYNPDLVMGPAGRETQPADSTLFHEMGHAENNAYGTNRQAQTRTDGYHNEEEYQTITGGRNQPGGSQIPGTPQSPSENDYLADRNYPYRRTDHGSGWQNADGTPL